MSRHEINSDSASLPTNVIILSSVRWDFMWQRHHALAREFAELGMNVVFSEPHPRGFRHIVNWLVSKIFRSSAGATTVANPKESVDILSWEPRHVFSHIRVKELRNRMVPGTTLLLTYLPSSSNLTTMRKLQPEYAVYDNVLDWGHVPRKWYPPRSWKRNESELYRLSSEGRVGIVTDSRATKEKLESAGFVACLIHPAPDHEFIEYPWLESSSGPVGYFGTIRHDEIDVEYIRKLAETTPTVLVGEIDERSMNILRNSQVEIMGKMSLDQLVVEIDRWSSIMLPYRVTGRTETLTPAKIWNAISTGKPVYVKGLKLDAELCSRVCSLPEEPSQLRTSDNVPPSSEPAMPSWNDRALQMANVGSEYGKFAAKHPVSPATGS